MRSEINLHEQNLMIQILLIDFCQGTVGGID